MRHGRLRMVATLSAAVVLTAGTAMVTAGPALAYDSSHSCSTLIGVSGSTVTGGHCLGGLNGPGPLYAGSARYTCATFTFGPQDPAPYFATITGYQCVAQ